MTKDRPLPLFATLTQDSSRAEVLAALAELDERDANFVMPELPEVPDGYTGCVWSLDGSAVACRGSSRVNPSLEAQKRAGEEDQSQPGWDGA